MGDKSNSEIPKLKSNNTIEEMIINFQEMIPDSMFHKNSAFMEFKTTSPAAIWDSTHGFWRNPSDYFQKMFCALDEQVFSLEDYRNKLPNYDEYFSTNYNPGKIAKLMEDVLPFFHFDKFKKEWNVYGNEWKKSLGEIATPYRHSLDSARASNKLRMEK